jgi:hypothetical protein
MKELSLNVFPKKLDYHCLAAISFLLHCNAYRTWYHELEPTFLSEIK